MTPRVTVLVCTRNRAAQLAEGLQSIIDDASAVSREIIVVDNASTDGTEAVVQELERHATISLRYVREPVPGLSAARNRGVAEAKAPIVLFTDDDTLVETGWADALSAPFSDAGVGAAGGRVMPAWPVPPPGWMVGFPLDLLAMLDLGSEPRDLGPARLPVGANLAVRRDLLLEIGFDLSLGHHGATSAGYEEVALLHRVMQVSRVVYAPGAVVRHRVAEDRMTRASIRRAAYHNGFGQTRFERSRGRRAALPAAMVGAAAWGVRARARRTRNDRLPELTPERAEWEFSFYRELGRHLEAATGWAPRINRWAMEHLA